MTVTDDFAEFEEAPAAPARKAPAKKAPAKRGPKKAVRPANAPVPQDHQPKKAAVQSGDNARRREADGLDVVDIEVEVNGQSLILEVPAHQGDWPIRTAQLMSRGQHIDGLESLLGSEQWDTYLALNATVNDLNDLVRRIGKELGLDNAGN